MRTGLRSPHGRLMPVRRSPEDRGCWVSSRLTPGLRYVEMCLGTRPTAAASKSVNRSRLQNPPDRFGGFVRPCRFAEAAAV